MTPALHPYSERQSERTPCSTISARSNRHVEETAMSDRRAELNRLVEEFASFEI
jgi:hypothetical protein